MFVSNCQLNTWTARSTLHFFNFLPKFRELVSRILPQGGKVGKCHSSLKKITNKHQEDFPKVDNDCNYLMTLIL